MGCCTSCGPTCPSRKRAAPVFWPAYASSPPSPTPSPYILSPPLSHSTSLSPRAVRPEPGAAQRGRWQRSHRRQRWGPVHPPHGLLTRLHEPALRGEGQGYARALVSKCAIHAAKTMHLQSGRAPCPCPLVLLSQPLTFVTLSMHNTLAGGQQATHLHLTRRGG